MSLIKGRTSRSQAKKSQRNLGSGGPNTPEWRDSLSDNTKNRYKLLIDEKTVIVSSLRPGIRLRPEEKSKEMGGAKGTSEEAAEDRGLCFFFRAGLQDQNRGSERSRRPQSARQLFPRRNKTRSTFRFLSSGVRCPYGAFSTTASGR